MKIELMQSKIKMDERNRITNIYRFVLKRDPSDFEIERCSSKPDIFIRKKLRESSEFLEALRKPNIDLLKQDLSVDSKIPDNIKDIINIRPTQNNIALTITYNAYPFGGGEAYLYHCCKLFKSEGFKNIWLYFENKKSITSDFIEFHQMNLIVNKIEKYITDLNPSVIHIQGQIVSKLKHVLINLKNKHGKLDNSSNIFVGYHYWYGIVHLDPVTHASNILQNIDKHKLDDEYIELQSHGIKTYIVSEFMNSIIKKLGGQEISNIIYPISDEQHYKVKDYNPNERNYIAQINIHPNKGGDIFFMLAKLFPSIKFICTKTENDNSGLYCDIKKLSNVEIYNYIDPKEIYSKAKIVLMPNKIDETFSRVAFECADNGIPVITTGNGFIKEMLDNEAIYCSRNIDLWEATIKELYNNNERLSLISKTLKSQVQKYKINKEKEFFFGSFGSNISDINNTITNKITQLKRNPNNFMILCPWGDTGLGIQSRFYCNLLKDKEFKVYIFSYKPYFLIKSQNSVCQTDPQEWNSCDDVYYSSNIREGIKDEEIKTFIDKFEIGKCLIPEICHSKIFEICNILRKNCVQVYAIPNIECIRKSEINSLINDFDKILCPTKIAFDKIREYMNNITTNDYKICDNIVDNNSIANINTEKLLYLGHGIERNINTTNKPNISEGIQFLHIGGYNALYRKQTLNIIKEFKKCTRNDIFLTVTLCDIPIIEITDPRITVLNEELNHKEIMELYKKSHISIQISTHEGLGLGFYESISSSTPVITFDYPPHNEIVKDKINGWYINYDSFILKDNDEALIHGCKIVNKSLTNFFNDIKSDEVSSMIKKTSKFFEESEFTLEKFKGRFYSMI